MILFLIDIFIILYSEIQNKNKRNNFMDYPFVIFIYISMNIIISVFVVLTLILLRKSIKNLSAAKGEIYESAKIEEVQIINSVINEI